MANIPYIAEARVDKVRKQLESGLFVGRSNAVLLSMELKKNYTRRSLESKLGVSRGSISKFEAEMNDDLTQNTEEYLQY